VKHSASLSAFNKAAKLYQNIFKQCYLPDDFAARAGIDEVLDRLSDSSPLEEAIFRLRMISAYKPELEQQVARIIDSTLSEITEILGPLIVPDSRDGFRTALSELLRDAAKLWGPIQPRMPKRLGCT
jgi:hypothetical protein